jgi:lipopolysaccharide export system protein LptA
VIVAALALALLAAPSTASFPAAGGGQVTVEADQFKYSFAKQRLEYKGDPVRFTRGESVLTCKHLVAQLDKAGEVDEATCEGDVRFVKADKVVTCDRAVYQAGAQRLTCTGTGAGRPKIQSGALSATGDLLVYDLANDEVTMEKPEGSAPAPLVDAKIQEREAKKKQKQGGPK